MEDGETAAGRTSFLLYGRPRTGLRTFAFINYFLSIENIMERQGGVQRLKLSNMSFLKMLFS